MAVDKARMRHELAGAGIPMPAFTVPDTDPSDVAALHRAVRRFAGDHGWPLVLKAARGGYDGKGVWPVADPDEAGEVCRRAVETATPLLVEECVAIEAELAVLTCRRPGGEAVTWPAVETAQVGGVCREVLVPGRIDPGVLAAAADLARRVAAHARSVGVLAVELFVTERSLLVNEVAARPHNSGHWTIEGAVTSQFENHLRAVLDLPLGGTEPTAPHVASVNVFGDDEAAQPSHRLADALAVPGAHVHLYGKAPRPGRKLGHVTVTGSDAGEVRARAWAAARALRTPVPPGMSVPS
jgi:5-(carboxyamino)imidazole ribonucleotide synthase